MNKINNSKLYVKQHDIKDCGAASLLSIIKYYNGYIPLSKIKEDAKISKEGITAYNLISAARKYGFDAYGMKVSFNDLVREKILLPAIAYLELKNGLRHFIVIYRITKKYILVMDPNKGFKKINYEEFKLVYKEVLLIFSPRAKIIKYEQKNNLFDVFKSVFLYDKKLLKFLIITSILLIIFSIISSFYMKYALYTITNNLNNILNLIIIIFLFITLSKVIISYLQNYYANYFNKNIDTNSLIPFIHHIFYLPLNLMEYHTSGEVTTRVNEIQNIKNLFSEIFVSLITNVLLLISSCIVLYFISKSLFISLLAIIIIYFISNLLFIKPINNYVIENISYETDFNHRLISYIKNFSTIKNINDYSYFMNKIDEVSVKYLNNNFKFNKLINIYTFINNFILEIGLFVANTYGFYLLINNSLSLINLITFNSIYMYLIDPVKNIISLFPKYFYISKTFDKINDFTILKEEKLKSNSSEFVNGDINIENISFTYDDINYPLKDLNVTFKKGSKILLMGKSGIGKSTIFKLLYRLYEPNKGTIKINNINILDYDLKTLRDNIIYVSQHESLFDGTIKENITLNKDIDIKFLNDILSICQVDEIIDKKNLRLESYVLEDVQNFSGGELARLVLARGLIQNKDIILLDESFSQIEEDDANKMIKKINNYFKDKTIIYICHFKPNYSFDLEMDLDNYV